MTVGSKQIKRIAVLIVFQMILTTPVGAQQLTEYDTTRTNPLPIFYQVGNCKYPSPMYLTITRKPQVPKMSFINASKPQTIIEAELTYQYFTRRSASQSLFFGHSESNMATLRFAVLYKGNFPVQATVRYNKTTPFQLDNQWSVDLGFDQRGYASLTTTDIKTQLKERFSVKAQQLLQKRTIIADSLHKFQSYLQSPALAQHNFEARQLGIEQLKREQEEEALRVASLSPIRQLPFRLPSFDTSGLRSKARKTIEQIVDSIQDKAYRSLLNKRDSIEALVKNAEDSIVKNQRELQKCLDSVDTNLSEFSSTDQVSDYAGRHNAPQLRYQGALRILAKTNVKIGRFLVQNSELTVSDIFLFGGRIRYGNTRFVSLSAGKYDFAFRQLYQLRNDSLNPHGHSLLALKFGKETKYLLSAINFYIGRKESSASTLNQIHTVAGYSYERKMKLSKNASFGFELAKSTPRFFNDKGSAGIKQLFTRLDSKSLAAYGAAELFLPKSKTDITASYQYRGHQFESLNANSYYNPQSNALIEVSQPLLNRTLMLKSGLRYTDFKSYGISNNIKTKTWFASGTAVLRVRNLPIISLGYYPGSQLYQLDKATIYEYYYYVLSASAVQSLRFRHLPVQILVTYNRFFNRYSDSLKYASQKHYSATLSTWKGKFAGSASYSRQEFEHTVLWVAESSLRYGADRFSLSGGLKLNFTHTQFEPGYNMGAGLRFNHFGTVNLQYDKSFLPEQTGKIIPVQSGRVQLIKPLKFSL